MNRGVSLVSAFLILRSVYTPFIALLAEIVIESRGAHLAVGAIIRVLCCATQRFDNFDVT